MHSWHSSIIIPTGKAPSLLFMVIKAGFKEKFVSLSKSHRDAFCASFASELSFVEAERDYDSPVFSWHFAWSRCWFRVTICHKRGFTLSGALHHTDGKKFVTLVRGWWQAPSYHKGSLDKYARPGLVFTHVFVVTNSWQWPWQAHTSVHTIGDLRGLI